MLIGVVKIPATLSVPSGSIRKSLAMIWAGSSNIKGYKLKVVDASNAANVIYNSHKVGTEPLLTGTSKTLDFSTYYNNGGPSKIIVILTSVFNDQTQASTQTPPLGTKW